jgi:hypothetical protein
MFKIIKGKEKEWRGFKERNSKDGYSACCIKAIEIVGDDLDRGKTPKEAMNSEEIYGLGLTGFMAGCVASSISHYHTRGEEFRRWWNKDIQLGDEGNKANKEGGVLNPALLNIGVKE